MEGIDAPGAPKIRKGMRFYGTNAEAIKMDQMVDAATSPEERRGLTEKDVSYSARPLRKGVLGLYDGRGVQLERQGGLNTDVTGHESNHALRHRGGDRKGILVRHNDSPNVEESCTVAEEMARTRDLRSSHGYYEHVAVWDGDAGRWRNPTPREQERMIREDIDLFTYGGGKPLKGKAAIRSVEDNWEHSHIARLRYKSRRMAIDEIASQDPSFSRAASDAKIMARAYAPGEKPIRPRPTKRGESPKTACMQPGSKPGTRTKKGKPGGAKKTQSGRASGRRGAAKAGKNAGRRK